MSLTIYYEVRRDYPLSAREKETVSSIVSRCNHKPDIAKLVDEGGGELFGFYPQMSTSNIILKGSVKLPLSLGRERLDDFIYVAETWIDCLSEIRNNMQESEWSVHLDDEPIIWNEEEKKFDIPMRS